MWSKFENILSHKNSHGIKVLKAGLEASDYKESARYITQVESCLSWFQVLTGATPRHDIIRGLSYFVHFPLGFIYLKKNKLIKKNKIK